MRRFTWLLAPTWVAGAVLAVGASCSSGGGTGGSDPSSNAGGSVASSSTSGSGTSSSISGSGTSSSTTGSGTSSSISGSGTSSSMGSSASSGRDAGSVSDASSDASQADAGIPDADVPDPVHPVQTALYVSPSGSGTACSLAAPCTLTQARASVATLAPSMTGDVVGYLRGGTYRLSSTFQLGVQDSGQNGFTVVYAAYPGEVPVLSGASQVTGFSLADGTKGIYGASVPVGTASRQLYVNGTRAVRARGPYQPGGFTLTGSSFVTSDASYVSFKNAKGVEVAQDNGWKHLRCPLASITATSTGGSSLNVDPTCFANNNTHVLNLGFPFNGSGLPVLDNVTWVENAYELLDTPGEFYIDSAAGALYYMPRPGEDMTTADVELPLLEELVDLSGTPGHLTPINDTDSSIVYTGSWFTSAGRAYGDFGDDVHVGQTDGDSASYTFTGTGIEVLSETNKDEGKIDVYLDGSLYQSVSALSASERFAQQAIVSISGLDLGTHTLKLVKAGGTFMLVDAFTVIPTPIAPVHDITFRGITFAFSSWLLPSTAGYIDNQSGVLWDPATKLPRKTPAAIQVHRGNNIWFTRNVITHTGGTGIDVADGTQNSVIKGNWITDTSGTGVNLGEVDDYYVTLPALMSTADTVAHNTITYMGMDYHDNIGILAGYTRNAVIANNEVAYGPYGGISLGWGWGWESPCTLQTKQGLTNCRRGTNYAGNNQILSNDVHNFLLYTNDSGAIYTLGGQGGGDGSMTSILAGNVLNDSHVYVRMIYHDEGSSYWHTYSNITRFGSGHWIGLWTPTIHDITIDSNYSDMREYWNSGTNIKFTQATIVTNGAWPPAAKAILAAAGPSAAYRVLTGLIDDDNNAIDYQGGWMAFLRRGYGDLNDGAHVAQSNGASASLTFTGTGVAVLSETYTDEGDVEVFLDDTDKGLVSAYSATRKAQQVIYSVSGLTPGSHTIKLVQKSGTFMVIDGFDVTRTVNDNDASLVYSGTWQSQSGRGEGDYGDDVHETTADGDSVTVTFFGSAASFSTPTNSDEGVIAVSVDGIAKGTVDASSATPAAQQILYSIKDLPVGRHTLTLTKQSGTYMRVDRFDVN